MAGAKAAENKKEKIEIVVRMPNTVSYADHALSTVFAVQIENGTKDDLSLIVKISDQEGLIVPFEAAVKVPVEGRVELNAEGLLSPLFLAENERCRKVPFEISAYTSEGKLLKKKEESVLALAYDFWEGIEGNPERLSCFVRPRLADCSRLLEDAGRRLKKWSAEVDFLGYTGADKNAVRQILASVFAAIKGLSLSRTGECDLSSPLSAFSEPFKTRQGSHLELAIFSAACLEAARLHPILAVGRHSVGVGVWLYDSCFLDPVTDDREIVGKYLSDGINNLSFFDVEDLYSDVTASFTTSEGHFLAKLKRGEYEYFTDVKRCRIEGLGALPLKGKGIGGFDLIGESEMSDDSAPAPLFEGKKMSLENKLPKNKQWERRLLDLTVKNALLSFTGKNALHIACTDPDALFLRLIESEGMKLIAGKPAEPFGGNYSDAEKQLLSLEERKGLLKAGDSSERLSETARLLFRKNREADEESGAKILYLSFGFLKYIGKEDKKERYAPLVLVPVDIKRGKGGEDYTIRCADKEFFANATLLEYLKQEFNIDIRGLSADLSALKISEIFAMILAEVQNMKGWEVVKDVYLATFSFQRFLMWNDVRSHFDVFQKNALVKALLEGRIERGSEGEESEDEGDLKGTLTPLPCDSSQYAAIALSRTGESFVLHGPPGTGKSQTITNIIANALEDERRVLFVAEKKAALDVVKKRLDGLGVGEFCLELHSNKTDKSDVLKRLEETLSLSPSDPAESFSLRAEEIAGIREELKRPMLSLHKKRRLGVSVFEAILLYLKNKGAPDVMDIESSFYDTLDEEKLSKCRGEILRSAAAAKECGGVFHTPFENVCVYEYSQALRDRIFCAAQVLLSEIKHLKAYSALFLEFYRQKISTLTRKKIENLTLLAKNFLNGAYDKYFSKVTEEQFYTFYRANVSLDEKLDYYFKRFKILIDLGKDEKEIKKQIESGGELKYSKAAQTALKKLSRAALSPLSEEDGEKYLKTLLEIRESIERMKTVPLYKNFSERFSDEINYKKRAEYLADLKALHKICASTFLDYNPDAFNGMCVRAQSGYTVPVLNGFLKAVDSFRAAEDAFLTITNADRNKISSEDVLEYDSLKAAALIDNIDMLPNWCMYQKTGKRLRELGCSFVTDALESGKFTGENILAGFEKNVYKNFLEITIAQDSELAKMSAGTLEETVEKFRTAWEDFSLATKKKLRFDLISRLPKEDGALSIELSAFKRLSKSNLRGTGLRGLFSEIPELSKKICPCMLMSPSTVAQYLQPEENFDLVIFDEASQMMTAEAIGSIARAKAAIVVGDPKQLPPTSFFHSVYVDEENLENEDLESVLDDCLALGMKERHLRWHYRSRHESLIAFSNSMYYGNRLCTFPSPDAMESKVKFYLTDGTYDRGFTKRNRKEAEALVSEVIRRLQDPTLSRSSMGVVTFSSAQQADIEKLLVQKIAEKKLESVAYEREEPLFVKNLENVQGDERDVILFSICYGPDREGKVSLNFGPLNQAGGWRRLNVAVSRAREEMVVFSSMTYGMIDLSKTSSKGVANLKAFLEFAERGRTTLAVRSETMTEGAGIGKYFAKELKTYGYECRTDVGASDFKIDAAVIDPENGREFLLAVLFDGNNKFSIKDRNLLQIQTLKRANWNVARVNSVNFYSNPKREVKRVKDLLDRLTKADKKNASFLSRAKPYKAFSETGNELAAFITSGVNDGEIQKRIKDIAALEEPLPRAFLRTRVLESYGISKSGARINARLDSLIDSSGLMKERLLGVDCFYKKEGALSIGKFRLDGERQYRKSEEDFVPTEVVSFLKAVLEDRVSLYFDELYSLFYGAYGLRPSEKLSEFLRGCIALGEERGFFIRSLSDRISLS